MDLNQGLVDLVAVGLVAALAPLLVAILPGPRIPAGRLRAGSGPAAATARQAGHLRLADLAVIDAVGYGVFIPIFFISPGMTLDVKAISQDPVRMLLFFVLLLLVRGLPSLLVYRNVLRVRQRAEMTFITATTLPLLIALAEIGQRDGVMLPATAAAMVGAGVLSVLVYPLIAVGLHRSAPLAPADAGVGAMETATRTSGPPENPDLTAGEAN